MNRAWTIPSPRMMRSIVIVLLCGTVLAAAAERRSRSPRNGRTSATNEPASLPEMSEGETNSAPVAPGDYKAFRIINDRNIFNANRTPRSPGSNSGAPAPAAKPAKVESFSLVGTMSYEKGDVAFFDSSSSGFRKAVRGGDTFAGYVVAQVSNGAVKLEMEGKTIELAMGAQMRRQDDGPWEVKEGPKSAAKSEGSGGVAAASKDEDDDIVKRMLKKREEEMNK